jgi:hypothetical protein
MSGKNTIGFVLLLALTLFWFGESLAQDPGVADTVRLGNISGEIADNLSMPVFLCNDEELSSVVIPLLLDGYSGWLRFDSVSYVDSRLADPLVLDYREAYVFGTDIFTVDSLLLSFSVSSGDNLPIGTGKLCDLWFTLHFGGEVVVDSLPDSPQGGLSLTDTSKGSFTPQFSSGLIDIACNYLTGDVSEDGIVDLGDVITHHKMYLYDSQWWDYPILERAGRFDLNCDRRLDMRDLIHLSHHINSIGPEPCTCGTVNPPLYHDPSIPDTIWVESETLIVGIPSPVCIGIVNDEPLSGLSLMFEMDGSAVLDWDTDILPLWTDRISDWVGEGIARETHADGTNPDTFQFYAFHMTDSLPPGRDAVCCPHFIPLSAGTVTFRLVAWANGSESMLVTEDHAAILPTFYGGQITVLPYLAGDANHDGVIELSDVVYLLNYLFKGDDPPEPLEAGDVNCDGIVDLGDVVYLLSFLFKGGPPPCEL